MERKQGAAVHPSRVIARPQRPRLVVAPRTYMDFMTPNTERPKSPVKATKAASAPVQLKPPQQPQKTTSFDIKPLSAPSKVVQHTSPALKPITKVVITPPPQQVAQLPVITEEPAVLEINTVSEVAKPAQPTQRRHHRPTAHKKPGRLKRLFGKPTKHHVLHGVSVLLFVAGVYVAAHGWFTNQAIQQQASVLGAQAKREEPVENIVSSNEHQVLGERLPIGLSGYSVEPDLPRVLHIPSLSVMSPVLHLGMQADGSLKTSKNIYETGWYKASARPTDETGAIVINGHVSGPTKQGVFHGLGGLKTGEEVVLERGDRHMMTFVVKRVEMVEAHQLDITKLLSSVEPARLGLNLITDGDKHTIVYAVLK